MRSSVYNDCTQHHKVRLDDSHSRFAVQGSPGGGQVFEAEDIQRPSQTRRPLDAHNSVRPGSGTGFSELSAQVRGHRTNTSNCEAPEQETKLWRHDNSNCSVTRGKTMLGPQHNCVIG